VERVLLDTHAFLWWCEGSSKLSKKARQTISQADCFVSLASLWEIAIKISLGKLKLPAGFGRYIPEQILLNGFSRLEIGFRHIAGCATLPWHHRDPFDRLLAAQAIEEGLSVVSRDQVFGQYGVRPIW
jgi:PIN domain nuclease of toxin-antitoxin system